MLGKFPRKEKVRQVLEYVEKAENIIREDALKQWTINPVIILLIACRGAAYYNITVLIWLPLGKFTSLTVTAIFIHFVHRFVSGSPNAKATIISTSVSIVWMWLPFPPFVSSPALSCSLFWLSSVYCATDKLPWHCTDPRQPSGKRFIMIPKCMCLATSWRQRKSTRRTILEEIKCLSIGPPRVQQGCDGRQVFRWTGLCLCQ